MLDFPSFEDFFTSVHGYAPFPWQSRLARVVESGNWPDLNVPTGCGKTCLIDVWIYDLARRAHLGQRINHRRLVYVVDRRIVVDGAFEHAWKIATSVDGAANQHLQSVKDSLNKLGGEGVPIKVSRMRGGTWKDESWATNPCQPLILVSTVDQAGSRLLGRGYGCSKSLRIVSAGLLGNDCLWVVDEAHLSQPAVATVRRIAELHLRAPLRVASPPTLVELTATPRDDSRCLGIDNDDRKHPQLRQRLEVSKPTSLHEVAVGKQSQVTKDAKFVSALVEQAEGCIARGRHVVGVVVNRVATARQVFEAIRQSHEAILLTGRCRPHDRDKLLHEYLPWIRAGRKANPEQPLIVVATQCIEVGADIDFDALVTEAAPIDALRQRFGRLNRLGQWHETTSSILCRSDSLSSKCGDFVYGEALKHTWAWLTADDRKEIDFGLSSLPSPSAEELKLMLVEPTMARTLLAEDVEQLAAINLPTDIDLGLFLHGTRSSADAYVVWRDDLGPMEKSRTAEIAATVAARPPRAGEQLPVPVWQLRQWINGLTADVTDVEGAAYITEKATAESRSQVLLFDSEEPERSSLTDGTQIRPGQLVIVPSKIGGCDRFGWASESREEVPDIGDLCAWSATGFPMAHLPSTEEDESRLPKLVNLRPLLVAKGFPIEQVGEDIRLFRYPAGWLLISNSPLPFPDAAPSIALPPNAPGEQRQISLADHTAGVAHWAQMFAMMVAPPLADSVSAAAWLHDAGKADIRWQYAIAKGMFSDQLLAKSDQQPHQTAMFWKAWRLSGLPRGWRHETLSVRLAERCIDDDLALYLIGTHHGWGHPLIGVAAGFDGPEIDSFTLGRYQVEGARKDESSINRMAELVSRAGERFAKFQREYGLWQRCLIESLLILADWKQSAVEQEVDRVASGEVASKTPAPLAGRNTF